MKLIGILALEDGDIIFLPFRGKPPDLSSGEGVGTIVDVPTPDQDRISKEKEEDFSLAGRLNKVKKDE